MKISYTLQGIRESQIAQKSKIPNALCLEHMNRKRIIKLGIFQVGKKQQKKTPSFSETMYLTKRQGVADRAKKLKIPNALCLENVP